MSLRMKTLLAVLFSTGLVLILLVYFLWLDAENWVSTMRAEMGRTTFLAMQDWIDVHPHSREDDDTPAWGEIGRNLATSALIDQWVFFERDADGAWEPVSASSPELIPKWSDRGNTLRLTYERIKTDNAFQIQDGWICGLLIHPNGSDYLVRVHAPSMDSSYTDTTRLLLLLVGIVGTGTLILVGLMFFVLNAYVLNPLSHLLAASRRVSAGDFDRTVADPKTGDEINQLVDAFNLMMHRIRETHESMEEEIKGTEQRLIVAQRLSSTGTLAAGIAHEINNPLGGMINALRTLKKKGFDSPRAPQYIELIEEGLLRIQVTVKKILAFTPRQTPKGPVNLLDTASKAAALIRYKLNKQEVELVIQETDDDPTVLGDSGEIQQSILNLLINAMHVVAEETGRITIDTRFQDDEVFLTVADNGSGMTEEQLNQCMNPFFTTKKEGEGTGLGLAVVHNIMESHGGRLELESEVGAGTKVHMIFPVVDMDALPDAPEELDAEDNS
jgi:signal transduction histidine kinase